MRLIDADDFYKQLEEIRQEYREENTLSCDFAAQVIETVQDEYLANASTIDPESVRPKGEWITKTFWKKRRGHHVQLVFKKCSLCNTRVKARWNNNFCPNCGADMRGGA